MWELQRLTTLWASTACYRDSFTVSLPLIGGDEWSISRYTPLPQGKQPAVSIRWRAGLTPQPVRSRLRTLELVHWAISRTNSSSHPWHRVPRSQDNVPSFVSVCWSPSPYDTPLFLALRSKWFCVQHPWRILTAETCGVYQSEDSTKKRRDWSTHTAWHVLWHDCRYD
jgi:hypothetical protein